jgi:Dolichyl-phosphate-mannose-protein mannosyltransferase
VNRSAAPGRQPAAAIAGGAAAVALTIVFATALRRPLVTWPFAANPASYCCGHPDEVGHYELARAFRSGTDPGTYPPGFAVLTSVALSTPVSGAAAALVPAAVAGEDREKARVIATGRIVSLAFSGAAVALLYVLCLAAGIPAGIAAVSAPIFALAPLFLVQGTYALPDAGHAALIVGMLVAFFAWDRRRNRILEVLFGFLLGGTFAFKLVGVVIGLPPAVSMVVRSHSRRRTAATVGLSFLAGVLAFSGGFLGFASPSAIFHKVVVENARASRIRPIANFVHHVLSVAPGMGLLFAVLLLFAVISFVGRRALARARRPFRPLDRLPAAAIGAGLYAVGVSFSSNPFTRHMLPIYPLLVLFALSEVAFQAGRRTPGIRALLVLGLFVSFLAYGAWASRPVLASFVDDPVDRAVKWVRSETPCEPRVPPLRNFAPVESPATRPRAPGEPARVMIVHSAWLGRLTGSWWLKAAPADLRDVYHFEGGLPELRFWQKLAAAGEADGWRVIRSFGDDWKTPESRFLSALGRGYDQFVTAGRVLVVARAD